MRSSLFFAAFALSGCFLDEGGDHFNESKQAVETHNRLATNRLATNRLATNRLATNRLATNSLGELVALPETSAILDTESGRELYSYLATCALPVDVTIEADVAGAADTAPPNTIHTCSGGHCSFPGALGLAPAWLDQALDEDGKAWVSACILARVNVHATAEAISLRGANASLAVTPDEAEIYTLQEGAFFGDIFTDLKDPIDWNACRGSSQATSEGGGLALRDCTEPGYQDPDDPSAPLDMTRTQCGFVYAGDCRDFTNPLLQVKGWGPKGGACRSLNFAEGYYGDCRARAGKKWVHKIAITSYVSP